MAEIEIVKKFGTYWNIKADGIKKLAIATGIPNRVFGGSDMSRLKSVPGYIWASDNSIKEWEIEGLAEVDSQIIFWGEPLSLIPIKEPFAKEELNGLIELFKILSTRSDKSAFSSDSFYRLPQKGLFCFPLNLMEFIHSRQSKEILLSREAYNHPDLSHEKRFSHTMAVLVFQSVTGELPYTQSGGYEWIHEEMRNKKIPSLKNNAIDNQALIKAVDQGLACEEIPSLDKWEEIIKGVKTLPGSMTDSYRNSFKKQEDSFIKSFKRRKDSIKITLAILLSALVIWIGISAVMAYIEPPFTLDMLPEEVIQTYYQGISDLSTDTIDGTTTRKAGKGTSNQVATIYVLSKNKQAYSQGNTISPEYWEEKEYITLPAGYNVYGVSDLVLEDLGGNHFRATYLMWYPPTEDFDNPSAYLDPHEIYRTVEELFVIRDKRDRSWIIGEFLKISSELVPSRDVIPQPE